jgi:hypothetical protein
MIMEAQFKKKKRPGAKKGYNDGGMVKADRPGIGIEPTNQSTIKAKGIGAATRGGNFKV